MMLLAPMPPQAREGQGHIVGRIHRAATAAATATTAAAGAAEEAAAEDRRNDQAAAVATAGATAADRHRTGDPDVDAGSATRAAGPARAAGRYRAE